MFEALDLLVRYNMNMNESIPLIHLCITLVFSPQLLHYRVSPVVRRARLAHHARVLASGAGVAHRARSSGGALVPDRANRVHQVRRAAVVVEYHVRPLHCREPTYQPAPKRD